MNLPPETEVVVVGAGPAGLAVAACLQRRGISPVLLERASVIAPAWRRHYDRLHLHTSRSFSGLPYFPMPRRLPKYPSRQQVVEYLEAYAAAFPLRPFLGVSVDRIRNENGHWLTTTSAGQVRSRAVVVATGYNGEPVMPQWEGLDAFPGPVLHSSAYRNGDPFVDRDVLVVGFGNSGGEIALDLVEHGARPTVSVRGAVNIIPRDVAGIPILALALALTKLPPRLADAVSWPLLKVYYPSYRRLGLKKAAYGPLTQIARAQKIPLLDIGTIREVRSGRIQVEGAVRAFRGSTVSFSGGVEKDFQAVVLATGFRPALASLLPAASGVTNGSRPLTQGGVETDLRGLFLCGFDVSPTGMLREIGLEAKRIAAAVARDA